MNIDLKGKDYIYRDGRLRITMRTMAIIFFFTIFFMPDYFGVKVGFALNTQRIALIFIMIWIFAVDFRKKRMLHILFNNKNNIFIGLYLFVCLYTMLYRTDIGTLLNPLMDWIMVYYITIYFIESELSIPELIRMFLRVGFVLCILGLVEFVLKTPLFGKLETIKGIFAGVYVRDGMYRIMGPAHHALGYGLYLLILMPLTCYDLKNNQVNIFCRPLFFLLVFLNICLTGSRSTLGLAGIEIILLMLFSRSQQKKMYLIFFSLLFLIMIPLGILLFNTGPVQGILRFCAATIDGAFGTNYAATIFKYHSQQLTDSSEYRKLLPMIFTLDWLNPLVGRGNSYSFSMYVNDYLIWSIDNFYVSQYIKVAYPGLITSILLFLGNLKFDFWGLLHTRDPFYQIFFIIFFTYFLNLWWVDALGTLDFIFVLFGVLYVKATYDSREMERRLSINKLE